MTTDNKSFNQLVQYIDKDLMDVLSNDQRDTIYSLAASSIALKDRHDTFEERNEQKLSGLLRKDMDFGPPTKPEYGPKHWCCQHILSLIIGLSILLSICYNLIF